MRLTALPLATSVLNGLAAGLSNWFGGATLAVDLNRIPALAEDRERLWASVSAADFLSREEKRQMLGVEA